MKKLSQDDINSGIAGFLSFIVIGLVMSTTRLASLMFVEAITRYNVDRETASFPFLLCYMTRNSIGPMVGFLVKRFGFRAIIISGCLLSTIAIGGCFFAEDIVTVTILWGILYGFSFGFGTLSVPHFLSLHFSKHLDKANGFSYAGDTVGYFLLSLITEYSLVKYGVSGTFLIIAGVMLHSVPAAFLMKIPKKSYHETGLDSFTQKFESQGIPKGNDEVSCSPATYSGLDSSTQNLESQVIPKGINEINCSPATYFGLDSSTQNLESQDIPKGINEVSCSPATYSGLDSYAQNLGSQEVKGINKINYSPAINIEHDLSTQNLESHEIPKGNNEVNCSPQIYIGLDSSSQNLESQEVAKGINEINSSPATYCKAIESAQQNSAFHAFRVFLDPIYILIVIIQSSMLYNNSTIYTILIDVSRDHGVSIDHEVYIFLAISVAELFGRLFFGSITDAGYLTKLNFLALCFAGIGLLYAAIIWIKGSAMMVAFGFFFGLLFGGLMTVNTGLVTFYIDKEYHSIAVPSRLILYPPVSFTQAPLIGYFRDTLQSYDGLLFTLIGICCMSSVICLLIPHIIVWRRNR